MDVETFLNRIRRRETPFYAVLYRIAKYRSQWYLPIPRFLGTFLYYERIVRSICFKKLLSLIYYEPMFRARVQKVGKGLRLGNSIQGMPLIIGDLKIYIGNNVTINDITTFCGLKVFDEPKLIIGDNSVISDRVSIFVAKEVNIGRNCIVSSSLILDNPSHPVDPIKRRNKESISRDDIEPVIIEDDAWLSRESIILKGVRIGKAAIVAAGAVVTTDVEPFSIVAGNPARKVGEVPRRS